MLYNNIPKTEVNLIRRLFIEGKNAHQIAIETGFCCTTVRSYCVEFKEIRESYPEKLKDMRFNLPRHFAKKALSDRQQELRDLLPDLVASDPYKRLTLANLFRRYQLKHVCKFSESQFNNIYRQWAKENKVNEFASSKVKRIPDEDMHVLLAWRKSMDHRKWQQAVVILSSYEGLCLRQIAKKVELHLDTVEQWVAIYKLQGLEGLNRKPYTINAEKEQEINEKKSRINELLHQSPTLYGLNRTSWRTADLAEVYKRVHKQVISAGTVWQYLKDQGFKFRKAREVLTSPDPNFREKLANVQSILSKLGPDERFFSIDELGPLGIRMKGGRSYTEPGLIRTIPAHQKAKAYIVCTAALELSTNQVTHFYSPRKDTDEMIKLVDVLVAQYRSMEKLYLCWDAASWHCSNKLKSYLKNINSVAYRNEHPGPIVHLAPLPASAQFLNVIESVFSGLVKAVIHNSDYPDADCCKQAIDIYFQQRNAHFLEHPKKAGNIIWGKELVKPVFSPNQNCKDPSARCSGMFRLKSKRK
ncbi:MAG: IS630 family transposase [Bacteroidetes bacterium]|nr:IS630 family transposase [Bacteroidota bacterium]